MSIPLEEFEYDQSQVSQIDIFDYYKNHPDKFKSLNRLATQICGTPVSLVNMLDENFQFTVSDFGDWEGKMQKKENTVCQFTVQQDEILVIEDTKKDPKTKEIKALDEDSIRFYAGVPINTPDKNKVGALCVIDYKPNSLTTEQKQALIDLAKEIELRINLLRSNELLEQKNRKLKRASAFLRNSADILWIIDPGNLKIIQSWGAQEMLEIDNSKLLGRFIFDLFEEVDLQKHLQNWLDTNKAKRFSLPVKIISNHEEDIWVSITFSTFEDKIFATARNVTKQHEAEEKIRLALEEKEILLQEVHHRVKNNLAVISGLLQLERINSTHEEVERILYNSESRIKTIADIHEQLYKANSFKSIDVKEYVESVVKKLLQIHSHNEKFIEYDLKVSNITLNVNQALPMGLIINELVINAIKHAFEDQDHGLITISILEPKQNQIQFEVADNGKGLKLDPDDLESSGSLGFTLIGTLQQQLEAELEIKNGDGTKFIFTFANDRDRKGSISAMN